MDKTIKRETWKYDLWMAANIQNALANNKTCAILCATTKEVVRLKALFKNVPVKVKKVSKKYGGRGFDTVIIDEAWSKQNAKRN